MAVKTKTVSEELEAVARQFKVHQDALADAYIGNELAKAQSDQQALKKAQKRIAESLEALEPLRKRKLELEELARYENDGRRKVVKALRLQKFKDDILPVLPDVQKRLDAHARRVCEVMELVLGLYEEEAWLKSELGRINPELTFAGREEPALKLPHRLSLPIWGALKVGSLYIKQILKLPDEVAGLKWLRTLVNQSENGAKP